MHIEEFRDYCLAKPGVTEEMPFGDDTLVFKVMGRIFALSGINEFSRINLKCDPEKAIRLREESDGIQPGYHMNKKHWNTISTDGRIPDDQIRYLINHSYELVVAGLPVKSRKELANATKNHSL